MAFPPKSQVTLHTRRLRLEPLCEAHFEHLVRLDSDPMVMRFVGSGRARTRDEVAVYFPNLMSRAEPVHGLGLWAGFLCSDRSATQLRSAPHGDSIGSFVGWWTLQPPKRPDQGPLEGQAELGYRLRTKYWRQGFAKEGATELLRHGFGDLALSRIFAETMAVNEASRATMASVGMTYKRTFYMEFGEDTIPGTELGEVEYEITRDAWQAKQHAMVSSMATSPE